MLDSANITFHVAIKDAFYIKQASYCRIAASSLLVYDTIITLGKEVKYFWCSYQSSSRKRFSWIFFLNRYVGLFGAIVDIYSCFTSGDNTICKHPIALFSDDSQSSFAWGSIPFFAMVTLRQWLPTGHFERWTYQIAGMIGILAIDYILLLRALAFRSGDKRTARCLSVLFALEVVLMFAILLYVEIAYRVGVVFVGPKSSCVYTGTFHRKWATVYWIVPVTFELVLRDCMQRCEPALLLAGRRALSSYSVWTFERLCPLCTRKPNPLQSS
ncbi:hypothetical protein DFH11DRAFT_1251735 [Phellopilus nigrolimitatus]|nr:hypothetical protein DFH11DRAFT_1251735 [Phellopilus nigrolimitatus]